MASWHRSAPRALQIADGQIVVHRRCGNFGGRARVGVGFGLAQNTAPQPQQTLTPAQKVLLAGQVALLPQGGAVHGHAHIGRVVRQADEQIISQRAPPLGIGPQQVLRRKHPGRAVGELGVQLFLAAGQGVQQARRRGVDTHRVGAAVHAVHQRGAQHSQPHALHAGQHQLGDQVGTGGQCGQRHAAAQRLTVQLKQPRLDGQTLSPGRAAFQKRILAAVAAVALHRTHGQNAPWASRASGT